VILAAGTRLGPYEILAPLGAGGMGEVFRARDTRLGRDVAIKALPEAFAEDPERLARFEREARLLASLSHPNIAGILGLEEVEGRRYLVLEFVDGETLAARLARGPLPVLESLQVCAQVAAGVEAAHEAGVIHRDLKPGNVMLKEDGTVKVLDFGLAKSGGAVSNSTSDLSASPTMTYAATTVGVILGTAAYMSPEQARGKSVDRRTDVWSFGAVLYECLTGRQCFAGETLSDTISMILQRDPDWNALPSKTPLRVRQLLARCLERDGRKRLRDVGEARIALESSLAGLASGTELSIEAPAPGAGRGRGLLLPLAIGALIGVGLALLATSLRSGGGDASAPVVRYSITLPEGRELDTQTFLDATEWDISPDGQRVVARFHTHDATMPQLWWRRLSEAEWRPVVGSELMFDFPYFGSDSRTVYFGANLTSEAKEARMMKANLEDGSAAVAVCEAPVEAYAVWPIAGGRVLFVHSNGRQIAVREPGAGTSPKWQPIDRGSFEGGVDNNFMAPCRQLGADELFVGTTLYAADGWHRGTALLNVRTRKLTPILQDGQWPAVHPSGVLVFARGASILATRFDIRARRVRGEAVPLMTGVRTRGEWLPARFRLTDRGDLVTSPGGAIGAQRTLEWIDLQGNMSLFSSEKRAYSGDPAVSADARRVAVTVTNVRGFDEIWTFEGDDRSGQRAIQIDGTDVGRPLISRDGRRMAYGLVGQDSHTEFMVGTFAADAPPRLLARFSGLDSVWRAIDWFPDNRHVLCRLRSSYSEGHLAIFDADAPGAGVVVPKVILPDYTSFGASLSPDGRTLAFASDRSGRNRIYLCGISPDGVSRAPVAITRVGDFPAWVGNNAVWYGDSTRVYEIQVSTAGEFAASGERLMYDMGEAAERVDGGIPLSDGRALLTMRAREGQNLTRLDVVQNWWASIKGKLPR
jgi:hypothetical protein